VKIYLSAPLFTESQRRWNRELAAGIERHMDGAEVLLPQDFKMGSSYNNPRDFPHIFRACIDGLREADAVVAVCDGPDVDSGTALEMGVALQLGLPIIGLRTDYRESQERGVNLMIASACTEFLRHMSFGEDMDLLVRDLCARIVAALKKADRGK
jgi:nucleoside 2-deoxyribosyltransferase